MRIGSRVQCTGFSWAWGPTPANVCKVFERETLEWDLWFDSGFRRVCGAAGIEYFGGRICQGSPREICDGTDESIPQGLKPDSSGHRGRPKAEALGYLEAKTIPYPVLQGKTMVGGSGYLKATAITKADSLLEIHFFNNGGFCNYNSGFLGWCGGLSGAAVGGGVCSSSVEPGGDWG